MRIESAGERRSRLRVSYPIMEYTTRTESAELHQSEYSPLRLVKVRALCPVTLTVASSTGEPFSSFTMPKIRVRLCAHVVEMLNGISVARTI